MPPAMSSQTPGEGSGGKRRRIDAPAIDAAFQRKSRRSRQRTPDAGICPSIAGSADNVLQDQRSSTAPAAAFRPEILAKRLACGRIIKAGLLLRETRLFQFDGTDGLPERCAPPQPRRGLQSDYRGRRV